MRRFEILAVRLLPIIITIYFCIVAIKALNGIVFTDYRYLIGHSFALDSLLFILSWNNKRYHCSYNRALICNLMFIDIFSFLDRKFTLIEDAETFIYVLVTTTSIAGVIFIHKAIKHFASQW